MRQKIECPKCKQGLPPADIATGPAGTKRVVNLFPHYILRWDLPYKGAPENRKARRKRMTRAQIKARQAARR